MNFKERMENIAKMVGLELEEEFQVEGDSVFKYKITKDGLKYSEIYFDQYYFSAIDTLPTIIYYPELIIKKPWTPKYNENYFYPNIFHDVVYETKNIDGLSDKYLIDLNLHCKTRKGAEEKKKKILEFCKNELR
jgi:hypothetical protein